MIERGIQQPLGLELTEQPLLKRWIHDLWRYYPRVRTYSATINPTSVSANSELDVVTTVTGLSTKDIVKVNKPTKTADLSILDEFVSDTNELTFTLRNFSGSPIDPGEETYLITAIRL